MPAIITPATATIELFAQTLARLSEVINGSDPITGKPKSIHKKEVELTLVARHKGDANSFMVFSDGQDLEKVIETLQHHMKQQREKTVGFSGKADG